MDKNKITGGLWGSVVGDALGVPVEFLGRSQLKDDPVIDMRGFGTHSQPAGTWSDDSSLMIITVESLIYDSQLKHIGLNFIKWLDEGYWTPHGCVYDVGPTTSMAIYRIKKGVDISISGGDDELSNGNGSLMRILPVGLYYWNRSTSEIISLAHKISSITHKHPRSLISCGIYCLMVSFLLKGIPPLDAYHETISVAKNEYESNNPFANELPHFKRILSGELLSLKEDDIKSSGYVIHTLEASLWCFLNSSSYKEAVLKAVNLGDDADTTATVTGGLAGVCYGYDSVPEDWRKQVARHYDLTKLFNTFADTICL